MSGDTAGMENPAFSDDQADVGTSRKYKTVIDSNEIPHYMVVSVEQRAKLGKTSHEEATNFNETQHSSKPNSQDKGVPTAQVAPRVQTEQAPQTSETAETAKDVTDLDSVAIAMLDGTEAKTESGDKGSSIAVNMQLQRVKESVKKTNSLQDIFAKVKPPSQKELDPR